MPSLRRITQNRAYREGYESIDWGREKNYLPEEPETPEEREKRLKAMRDNKMRARLTESWET